MLIVVLLIMCLQKKEVDDDSSKKRSVENDSDSVNVPKKLKATSDIGATKVCCIQLLSLYFGYYSSAPPCFVVS